MVSQCHMYGANIVLIIGTPNSSLSGNAWVDWYGRAGSFFMFVHLHFTDCFFTRHYCVIVILHNKSSYILGPFMSPMAFIEAPQ